MRVGVAIQETWDFFKEIYEDLTDHYVVSLFNRRDLRLPLFHSRVNRRLFHHDLHTFLRGNQVVFFEWASELLAVASHLPKSCGIVTRLHRYELYQWADRVNWQAVDRIILVSEQKKQEFLARFPAQAAKVEVIPEAVSLTRFPLQPRPFAGNIGILCHLKPRKRVYELILAFHELLPYRPELHLHIGGGGAAGFDEYAVALRGLVEKLNLTQKVTFHGHVSRPEEWYPLIDIIVSNGYSEGLQVSPMEAMACGCYPLVHRWDGAEELLPEEHLFFTNSELNRLILRYCELSDEEKLRQQGRMRAIITQKFNVDRSKVRIRQIVEEVGHAYQKSGAHP